MNEFINKLKDIKKKSALSDLENDANESIIINPFVNKETIENKTYDDLSDEYNSEILLPKNKIIPGNIHSFIYLANTEETYEYDGLTVSFYDKLPIVLVMENKGNTITGVNLNLCTRDLKALVLNAVLNMDELFYNEKALDMANKKKFPISDKVTGFFQKPNAIEIFKKYLSSFNKNVDYSVIFRTYNVSKIRLIRYVEPWQWYKIPYINYKGSIKQDILNFIWKATGISLLKLSF